LAQGIGRGGILQMILIGAMAGIERVVPAILLGMVLAARGIVLIDIGKRGRRDDIPCGAYLCLGAIIVLLVLPREHRCSRN
jgi:prepilin signal peptidase PulO-like enzyme (type II secretory pathway)